jgi:formate dehydrogenase major subunit
MALVNLALLTGNLGKPGAGINPLRGQNNVQGSAHMGCEPDNFTGYVSVSENKESFEQVWQAPIPTAKGLTVQMMDAAECREQEHRQSATIFCSPTPTATTRRALRALEFLVVEDLFLNETAKECANVFLPAASSFEKDGTFMNGERRVQGVRKICDPPGQAKPDWEIICLVARAMGKGDLFNYDSAESIWNEVRKVWKAGSGISYERIEKSGLQWPCLPETTLKNDPALRQFLSVRKRRLTNSYE